ncbi:MAG TPA: hydroxyacylglutathione hydrolase [Paracoccaceae bacterium]|mgnify:CR=1 FL=1|nr:hydroxyacylglutathione hydrolase [Paracoccaceae bacterium]HMO70651.1 hydroxyacylglutathione hydrolase [Paracoccaceae bacterium]
MTIEIVTVPCLADNFAYIVKGSGEGEVALVDAPEAGPIVAALEARGWSLGAILITHHHHDHVGGVGELRARYGAKVVGPAAEAGRLPPLDRAVEDGDTMGAGSFRSVVMAVPGHTLGHVAYHFPEAQAVFTADSLMACGCGRVFEGTPAQMWDSLVRLAALPPETRVHSGHDYLDGNIRFAMTLEPDNSDLILRRDRVGAIRRAGKVAMPWALSEELATNPFLRAGLPAMKARMGLPDAPDADVFAAMRAAKDRF